MLKIGFVNFTPLKYDVETPYNEPLGGSESSMCYLAEHLAKLGHQVILFRKNKEEFQKRKVKHLEVNKIVTTPLDVLIIQNTPYFGLEIRERIDKNTKLILWSQHASNQPAVSCLKDKKYQEAFDKIVLLSDWQIEDYINNFNIDHQKIIKLKNAISPAFENLDVTKKRPWSYAYTSTPFRGLVLLPEIFTMIKKVRKDATLDLFSSMKVYQSDDGDYEEIFKDLKRVKDTNLVGSLSQTKLAEKLAKISYLIYPNIFKETACISVMEAMAAGCQVITSNLGALSETSAGFARLIDIDGDAQRYKNKFVESSIQEIEKENIKKQVEYMNRYMNWKVRSKEWEMFLSK